MNTEINTRKRERANSFIENADKIDNNVIFNYLAYLKLIKSNNNEYNETYKNISKKIHFSNNQVLRLDENSYIQEESFRNIKLVPDCFDEDGNLIDIYASYRNYGNIKINNISKTYNDYIQILLNILNLDKAVIYLSLIHI